MTKKLTKLLEDEISNEFSQLENLSAGSKEHTVAVDNVMRLYRMTIEQAKAKAEIEKISSESKLAIVKQDNDCKAKESQRQLDEKKMNNDYAVRLKQYELESVKRTDEADYKSYEKVKARNENIFKWCIGIAEIVLPLMFYAVWLRRGFQFEKEGTYTSPTFRHLFSNFKPTKK